MKKYYTVTQTQKELFFAKLKLGREWMPEVISFKDANYLVKVCGVDSIGEAKDLSKEQQIDFALAKRLIMVNPNGPDNKDFRNSLKVESKKMVDVTEAANIVGLTSGRISQMCNDDLIECEGNRRDRKVDLDSLYKYLGRKTAKDKKRDEADIRRDDKKMNQIDGNNR
ncbi:hypothetical protein ACFL02_01805 [Planctomycetota bacterium]